MIRLALAGPTPRELAAAADAAGIALLPARVLLHLPPRELAIFALIENRGFVVIAAALGLLSEFSVFSTFIERYLGEV